MRKWPDDDAQQTSGFGFIIDLVTIKIGQTTHNSNKNKNK